MATSSKLLWHLQNLRGSVCTAKVIVFHPFFILASCSSQSVLFKKTLLGKHVPLATAGLPAGCTLCEILEKSVGQSGVALSVILVALVCIGFRNFQTQTLKKGLRCQWGFWRDTRITMSGLCFGFPNTELRDYICDPVVIAFSISVFLHLAHSLQKRIHFKCVGSASVLA